MGIFKCLVDTPERMIAFREKYDIPDNVQTKLGELGDEMFFNNWMPFPLVAIVEGGVRFPLHPILKNCLRSWQLAPCQLSPNVFKVIMGTVEINKMIGSHFDVHDIEECYDVCQSKTGAGYYYLRLRKFEQPFVHDLEDSYKRAGDDRLLVSGEWEFGPGESRYCKIPRYFGAPASNCRNSSVNFFLMFVSYTAGPLQSGPRD